MPMTGDSDNNGTEVLLTVEDLRTHFRTADGVVKAGDGVGFWFGMRQPSALVGESGCGKSVSSMSILRLVPSPPGRIAGGRIEFDGEDLLDVDEARM